MIATATVPRSYEDILADAVAADERVIVMTAENRAPIRNLPTRIGPRFLDVGITEQTMVGMAAGLALRGRTPILHALASFLVFRPYEFIRDDVCIANLPVKLVGWVPGILSEANGPTHQAIEDIALMRGLPNMRVFAPASLDELLAGMPAVIDDPSPWYVRYNTRRAVWPVTPVVLGEAEVVTEGRDVAVLTYGALATEAFEAAQQLVADGMSVHFVNMRTLKPVDAEAIVDAARRTQLLVTVEDHFTTGGLASIVAEVLLAHQVTARHLPIGFDGRWFTPTLLDRALDAESLTGSQLAARIRTAYAQLPTL
jgi:transketolase